MIGLFIGLAVLAAVAVRVAPRRVQARRLRLAEASEARRERERVAEAEAAVFLEARRAYLRSYGHKVVDTMDTPRVSNTGLLHLKKTYSSCPQGQGCDGQTFKLHEVAPTELGPGVVWESIGYYCARCGAWHPGVEYKQHYNGHGPLGRRLKGATNLFDVIGDPKEESTGDELLRLEGEETALEGRLNLVRLRRLTLAEKLGKPMLGGPHRAQLMAKTGT